MVLRQRAEQMCWTLIESMAGMLAVMRREPTVSARCGRRSTPPATCRRRGSPGIRSTQRGSNRSSRRATPPRPGTRVRSSDSTRQRASCARPSSGSQTRDSSVPSTGFARSRALWCSVSEDAFEVAAQVVDGLEHQAGSFAALDNTNAPWSTVWVWRARLAALTSTTARRLRPGQQPSRPRGSRRARRCSPHTRHAPPGWCRTPPGSWSPPDR